MNMAGSWKFKFTIYFMERTHVLLHLDEVLFHSKILDIPTSFICIIILFDGAFEYGSISKLWGYVGTNTELLCAEFCNFVQYQIFVSYLVIVLSKVFWILEAPTQRLKSTQGYIIISSFYSSVEHRARVKVRHLFLFAAKAFTSAQLFFSGLRLYRPINLFTFTMYNIG
jgi:hypothetical protein